MKFDRPQEFISKLTNLYLMLVAGPMLLFAIVFLEYDLNPDKGMISGTDEIKLINTIISLFALAIIAHGIFYHFRFFRKSDFSDLSLQEKLKVYRKRCFRLYFFLTGASLLVIAGYIVTAGDFYIIVYAISLVTITRFRPTLADAASKTKATDKELEKIRNDENME